MNVRIRSTGHGKAVIEIDGKKVTGVRALRVDGAVGQPNAVTLQFIPEGLNIDVDAQVKGMQPGMEIVKGSLI